MGLSSDPNHSHICSLSLQTSVGQLKLKTLMTRWQEHSLSLRKSGPLFFFQSDTRFKVGYQLLRGSQ